MTPSSLPVCVTCGFPLDSEDSVTLIGRSLAHVDCQRPKALTAEERLLLAAYGWNHTVADCETCQRSYRLPELVATPVDGLTHFCPFCRGDMIDEVRAHLYRCTTLPDKVRRKANAARDTTRRLVKRFRELAGDGDVLRRETEVALRSLRETMRGLPSTRTMPGRTEGSTDDNQQSI